jgi:hypothetical protein
MSKHKIDLLEYFAASHINFNTIEKHPIKRENKFYYEALRTKYGMSKRSKINFNK